MKVINLTINVVFIGIVAVAIAFAMYKLIIGAPVGTFCGMG